MKIVFLAGPYRSRTEHGVHTNIHKASEVALSIWLLGAACICPQKNTAFFGGEAPDDLWLEGDKEMLLRCDAVFLMPAWRESPGTLGEVALAKNQGIPIFENLPDLADWVRKGSDV